jgi:sulfhydrogenase subunit alpha
MIPDLEATVDFVRGFRFPEFERETEYVALVSDDDEYPLLMGDIGSSDGVRLPKREYRNITNEFVVPHSTAKHTRLSRDSYMVGALARLNLNQLVECFHCLYHAVDIVEEFLKTGLDYDEETVVGLNEKQRIPVRAGSGVGAVEAPRGTLYHHYEVDDHGRIVHANCVIPTGQNLRNIEYDMRKLVPEVLGRSEEEIQLALEMLVRAYDPCISCSTHFLNVTFVGRENPEGS